MKEYLVSVIIVTAISSLSLAAAYKDRAEKGALRIALGVLLLYTTVSPLLDYVAKQDFSFKIEEEIPAISTDGSKEVAERAFAEGVRLFIADEFSLDKESIFVSVRGFDVSSMSAELVSVTLRGGAVFADARRIEEKIEKNGLGKCEVHLEIG